MGEPDMTDLELIGYLTLALQALWLGGWIGWRLA
jgi:hypothetical protein